MAVLSINRISGESSDYSKIIDSSASLQWLAKVSSRQDKGKDILLYGWNNEILPFPFEDFFPDSPILSCRHIKAEQDKSAPLKWIVTADYSSEPLIQADKDEVKEENPLMRPARIKWSTNKYLKGINKDINGKAIVNSAGDFFDPTVEIDCSHWTATIQKNLPWVPSWLIDYDNTINSKSFNIQGLTIQPYKARIDEIEISEPQEQNGYEFVVFTYKLEFRGEGFKLVVQDQGMRQKVAAGIVDGKATYNWVKCKNDDGSDVTAPVPLDGSGGQLENPTVDTIKYLSFDGYNAQDFNVLPLE
jgi:hypothetical protein